MRQGSEKRRLEETLPPLEPLLRHQMNVACEVVRTALERKRDREISVAVGANVTEHHYLAVGERARVNGEVLGVGSILHERAEHQLEQSLVDARNGGGGEVASSLATEYRAPTRK